MYNEFWQCIRWWKWVCMNASLLRVAAPWSRVQHDLHSGSGLSNSGVPEPPSHPWLYPKSRKSGENRARKRRKNRRARSTHRKKDTPLAAPKTPYPNLLLAPLTQSSSQSSLIKIVFCRLLATNLRALHTEQRRKKEERRRANTQFRTVKIPKISIYKLK